MKKKFLLSWMLCLMGMGQAMASNVLTTGNVTLPQGGEATIEVGCLFETQFKAFQFDIELPEGLELVANSTGKPVSELGFSDTDHTISSTEASDGVYRFVCTSMNNMLLPQSGTLLKLTVKATGTPTVGDTFIGKVTNTEFTVTNYDVYNLTGTSFTITIGEPADTRVVIDEAATALPEAATGVDVRVKRTIKAGEWSTICLPFAMTEAQVKEVFGNDVQLLDFDDYEVQDDGNSINVSFNAINSIGANHPCVIKVTEPVSEFIVDGVDVDPEEEPMINKGTKRKPRAIIGNYVAGTLIENGCLFLSGNEFWYSVGKTKIKGLRAYFNFDDLLPEFEDNYAESRMHFVVNSETDGISDISSKASTDAYYDLQGRKVADGQQRKGIYVKQGKKMVVK